MLGEEEMILRLKDIVQNYDYNYIAYRAFLSDGTDIFIGACKYINGELISLDGDTYSLDDPILKYDIDGNELEVWVDKKWE